MNGNSLGSSPASRGAQGRWRSVGNAARRITRQAAAGIGLLFSTVSFGCQRLEFTERSAVPDAGGQETLDIASWNVAWFGSRTQGPRDEALQRQRVREVLLFSNLDLWALTEVVEDAAFAKLLQELPGYSGVLASDPRVTDGSRFYAATEQKPALIFKRDLLRVTGARLILTQHEADFAGRPPLLVAMEYAGQLLHVVVLHAKAFADERSYARRLAASLALKAYLDAVHPDAALLVLGDFNDDVDRSISAGRSSPYENFVQAASRYRFVTAELSKRRLTSTVNRAGFIDHHLVSDELFDSVVPGSSQVLSVDRYIPNYAQSTSDHYPVVSRFRLPSFSARKSSP